MLKQEVRDFTPDEAVVFGQSLEEEGNIENAERLYRSVLTVDPKHFHAQLRLGCVLVTKKSYYEGLYHLERACKLNRKSDIALSNRAMVMSLLGHFDEAIIDFERAVHIDPNNYITLGNYANTLERLERFDEAMEMFDRSLALYPDQDVTQHNRGIALFRLGLLEECIKSYNTTLRINPDYHQAEYNRGLTKLLMGDLGGGFIDCEVALKDPTIRRPLFGPFNKPQWEGEDFTGKTLIVTGEQGIGDTIMFMRYLPYVRERGNSIIVAIHEMARSLYNLPEGFKLLKHGETCPRFDLHSPLMSLPVRLGAPWKVPPPLPLDWYNLTGKEEQFNSSDEKIHVGLCYSGNFGHKHDADRSIPLSKLKYLLKVKNVQFYSLQKEVRPSDQQELERTPEIIDLGKSFNSFVDTAAAIQNLDLVITVDTSVAHLAASLGKTTWLLLQDFCNDWRWQRTRNDSPWYPSVTIYRQSKRGDWDGPLNRIAKALTAEAKVSELLATA